MPYLTYTVSMAFLEDSVDPLDLSAVQLARLMRTGHLDPVAHTERVLERARSRGAAVGAFTHIAEEFSLRQARAATAQLKEGKGGPLTGVPFPIKDLDDVAGLPTEYGSRAMRGNIATTTGGVAQSILDAGTVTIGKTTTPEFGFVGYTEPAGLAPARTPWDLTCSAGGSSGGAAAAVAAGVVPIAHGNDGGGSVRIPAAHCGVLGIKPSRGLVSPGPASSFFSDSGLATAGVLARTARDLAAGLDVIARRRPGDWSPYPGSGDYLATLDAEFGCGPQSRSRALALADLRVGVLTEPLNVDTEIHPACLEAVARAAEDFGAMGARVEGIARPFGPEAWQSFMPIWQAGAAAIPLPPESESLLTPMSQWLRARGREASAPQLMAGLQGMYAIARRMGEAFAGFDVILSPALGTPPADPTWVCCPDDPAEDFRRQCIVSPWTSSWNMFGPAAVSIPIHRAEVGGTLLPFGVHVGATRFGEEQLLLAIVAALETLDPWPLIRPPHPES